MRNDNGIAFGSPEAARNSRRNLGVLDSWAVVITATAYAVTVSNAGNILLMRNGTSNAVVTLPSAASVGNGFLFTLRKDDTASGRVRIEVGGIPLTTLYQEDDTAVVFSDGTGWKLREYPNTDIRPSVAMVTGGTLTIDCRANGRFRKIIQPLNTLTGTNNETNTIHLTNARAGDVVILYGARDAQAATKTVNFAGSGITYRKTWGTGAFTFPVSQRHRFFCRVEPNNEIYVQQIRFQP